MDEYYVFNSYPHDCSAFTQGLIYYQGELYESTGKYESQLSSLRRVELKTGKTLQPPPKIELQSRYFGEGITLWKDQLIQLTLEGKVGFLYRRNTFEKIGHFSYDTEGWGITHDGKRLIMSDGTDRLYFLNPETFEVSGDIQVQGLSQSEARLNELEYVEGEILANIYSTDCIARINPKTGHVIGCIDLAGLRGSVGTDDEWANVNNNSSIAVLNGIAYDNQEKRIFVTGKLWPYLFEIELVRH